MQDAQVSHSESRPYQHFPPFRYNNGSNACNAGDLFQTFQYWFRYKRQHLHALWSPLHSLRNYADPYRRGEKILYSNFASWRKRQASLVHPRCPLVTTWSIIHQISSHYHKTNITFHKLMRYFNTNYLDISIEDHFLQTFVWLRQSFSLLQLLLHVQHMCCLHDLHCMCFTRIYFCRICPHLHFRNPNFPNSPFSKRSDHYLQLKCSWGCRQVEQNHFPQIGQSKDVLAFTFLI